MRNTLLILLLSGALMMVLEAQTSWVNRVSGSGAILNEVTFADETYLAVGTVTTSGAVLTSPDGMTWTQRESGVGGIFHSVAFGNGRFVTVGTNSTFGVAAVSLNRGATWSGGPVGIGGEFHGVAWTGTEFLAVGGNGGNAIIATSTDGSAWTGEPQGVASTLKDIVASGTTRVAVGTTGVILYSLNGGTWTLAAGTPNVDWENVAFSNGRFLVVGVGGMLMSSPDGVTWTLGNSTTADNLFGLTALDVPELWVATGSSGRILVSSDALTWTKILPSPTGDILHGVTYGIPTGSANGRFVAVGTSGRISSSEGPAVGGGGPATFVDDAVMVTATGGSVTAGISAPTGTSWSANSGEDWIFLSAPRSGTGDGSIDLFINANPSAEMRSGSVTLGTDVLVIEQEGSPLPPPGNFFVRYEQNQNGIVLTWNPATVADGYQIERRSDPDLPFSLLTTIGDRFTRTYLDSGLPSATTFEYRIRTISGALFSDWSPIRTAAAPPDIPEGLAASARNASQIELTWDDVSGETGYLLYRQGPGEFSFNQIARLPADELRFIDTGLSPMNTYEYQIEAESEVFGRVSASVAATTPDELRTIVWGSAQVDATHYYGAAYGNGITVVLGSGGLITRSTDFINWTTEVSGTTATLRAVDFADGKFVAVGDGGTILISTDGQSWSAAASPVTEDLVGVAYLNAWYAVGAAGALISSVDGNTWAVQSSPALTGFVDIFASDQLVAIEESGRFVTSSDGSTWVESRADTPSGATEPFFWTRTAGAGEGDIHSAVGPNSYSSESVDALTWTEHPGGTFNYYEAVAYGNQLFVAVGINGVTGYSQSGGGYLSGIPQSRDLEAVVYAGDRFVAAGASGLIVTSPDGIVWTEVLAPSGTTTALVDFQAGGGKMVALAYGFVDGDFASEVLINQLDGTGWTVNPLVVPGLDPVPEMLALTYDGSNFVAVGADETVLTSSDGLTWTARQNTPSGTFLNRLTAVSAGGGVIMAGGGADGLIRSQNGGLNWSAVTDLPANTSPLELLYGPRWVGFQGGSPGLTFSDDSLSWASASVAPFGGFQAFALGQVDGEPLIVGAGLQSGRPTGDATTSWDGRNFSNIIPSGLTSGIDSIAYGAGIFLASTTPLGSPPTLLASLDGVHWEEAPVGFLPAEIIDQAATRHLYYHDGAFYGGGFEGRIGKFTVSSSDFSGPVTPGASAPLTISVGSSEALLNWGSQLGFTYQLRFSNDLKIWQDAGPPMMGTGSPLSLTVPIPPGTSHRFWRLEVSEA